VNSDLLSPIELKLYERLKSDKAYRRRFFEGLAQDEVAMQIRNLREYRGYLRQADFAKVAKMQQSAISRIENATYRGWSYRTLLRVAAALDARLRITFEPAEDAIRRYRDIQAATNERPDVMTTSRHGFINTDVSIAGAQIQAPVTDLTKNGPIDSDRETHMVGPFGWFSATTPQKATI
jgi:transcriptional regulator with XRE-family HTH domain